MKEDQIKQIEAILDYVCKYYNVSKKDVFLATRKAELVRARQVAMYISSKKIIGNNPMSINTKIAEICGGKNRSMVNHSINKIEGYIKIYPNFKKEIDKLIDDIEANVFFTFTTEVLEEKIKTLEEEISYYRNMLSIREESYVLGHA